MKQRLLSYLVSKISGSTKRCCLNNTPKDGWYIRRGGEQYGPYLRDEILHMLGARELGNSDLIWYRGMLDWAYLTQLPALLKYRPQT